MQSDSYFICLSDKLGAGVTQIIKEIKFYIYWKKKWRCIIAYLKPLVFTPGNNVVMYLPECLPGRLTLSLAEGRSPFFHWLHNNITCNI